MTASLEILVLGAGAMDSLFGGQLAETGTLVILVDIDQSHLDAIDRDRPVATRARAQNSPNFFCVAPKRMKSLVVGG